MNAAEEIGLATLIATVVIGIATIIVTIVLARRGETFKPQVTARFDEANRVKVDIRNRGRGEGQVDTVLLLPAERPHGETAAYLWEMDGQTTIDPNGPLPFPLAAGKHAVIFVHPKHPENLPTYTVRVDYGEGPSSGPVEIKRTRGKLAGTTKIPTYLRALAAWLSR